MGDCQKNETKTQNLTRLWPKARISTFSEWTVCSGSVGFPATRANAMPEAWSVSDSDTACMQLHVVVQLHGMHVPRPGAVQCAASYYMTTVY